MLYSLCLQVETLKFSLVVIGIDFLTLYATPLPFTIVGDANLFVNLGMDNIPGATGGVHAKSEVAHLMVLSS